MNIRRGSDIVQICHTLQQCSNRKPGWWCVCVCACVCVQERERVCVAFVGVVA